MANTVPEAVYVKLKAQFPTKEVRYPYSFDVSSAPYLYLSEVDDPRTKTFLCDTKGGESRITIGYISETFEDCVDYLESVIDYVMVNLVGVYSPINIWNVQPGSVRDLTGLDVAETKIYRREVDFIFSWGE